MSQFCDETTQYYQGNGTQVNFQFDFEYMDKQDVRAALYTELNKDSTEVNEYQDVVYWDDLSTDPPTYVDNGTRVVYPMYYTLVNATTIKYVTADSVTGPATDFAPPAVTTNDPTHDSSDPQPARVKIYRLTSVDPLIAMFYPGSSIRAQDLNDNFEQLKLAIEEGRCLIEDLDEEVQQYYWNKLGDTTYSTDTWEDEADDQHVPTTGAVDQQLDLKIDKTSIVDKPDQVGGDWINNLYDTNESASKNNTDTQVPSTAASTERWDNYMQSNTPAEQGYRIPGKTWIDTDDMARWAWDASAETWVMVAREGPVGPRGPEGTFSTIISDSPPVNRNETDAAGNPVPIKDGDFWLDSTNGRVYVAWTDPDCNEERQWVSPFTGGPQGKKGDKGDPGNDSTVPGPPPGLQDPAASATTVEPTNATTLGTATASVTADSNGDLKFAFGVPAGLKGDKGDNGQGVPAGGTTNQVLSKVDGTDYNTQWKTVTSGGGATNLAYTPADDKGTVTSDTGDDATIPLAGAATGGTNAGLITKALYDQITTNKNDISGFTGATNLGYTVATDKGTVTSDTGSDATIPLATTTNAGLMSPGDKTTIGGISNPLLYKGLVNLTSTTIPATPQPGWTYANDTGGSTSAEWAAVSTLTANETVRVGDLIVWNGTQWTHIPTGGTGIAQNLQSVTDLGDSTTNKMYAGATEASDGDSTVVTKGYLESYASGNSIHVGDDPPAAASSANQGNLWWNTDDGRLYVSYTDTNTSQWVDASPDNVPEAPESQNLQGVTDSGNTTDNSIECSNQIQALNYRVNRLSDGTQLGAYSTGDWFTKSAASNDDLVIAMQQAGALYLYDTVGEEDNIVLNKNGNATFKGTVYVDPVGDNLIGLFKEGQIWVTHSLGDTDLVIATRKGSNDQNFAVYGDGGIGIGPDVTTESTNKITLNANGNGNFAGNVEVRSTATEAGIYIKSDLTGTNDKALRAVNGAGAETVTITNNGSATFASSVLVGNAGSTYWSANSTGRNEVRVQNPSDVISSLGNKTNGETIQFKGEGSASFSDGKLTIDKSGNINKSYTISAINNGTFSDADTDLWNGYNTAVEKTSEISADGSATFASHIQSGGNPSGGTETGCKFFSFGVVEASGAENTNPVWKGNKTGTGLTSQINADGSATFAGGDATIDSAGNVTLNGYVFSNRTSAGNTCFRGTLNGATTFEVEATGKTIFGSDPDNQAYIASTGDLVSTRTSAASTILIGQQGGVTTSRILAGGSAEFDGSLTLGSPTQNGAGNGVYVGKDAEAGNITLYSEDNSSGGGRASSYLLGYSGGSSKTLKVDIAHDGSATFASGIQAASLTDGTTTKTMTEVLEATDTPNATVIAVDVDADGNIQQSGSGISCNRFENGKYRFTFDTALDNNNYTVVGMQNNKGTGPYGGFTSLWDPTNTKTNTSFVVACNDGNYNYVNEPFNIIVVLQPGAISLFDAGSGTGNMSDLMTGAVMHDGTFSEGGEGMSCTFTSPNKFEFRFTVPKPDTNYYVFLDEDSGSPGSQFHGSHHMVTDKTTNGFDVYTYDATSGQSAAMFKYMCYYNTLDSTTTRLDSLANRLAIIENADITDGAEHSALLTLVSTLSQRVLALEQGGNN